MKQSMTHSYETERIRLAGVEIDRLDVAGTLDHIAGELAEGRGGWVVTVNLDILRRLVVDARFAVLCEGATVRVADGMPLVWASRLQGVPLAERVAGSDLIWNLTERAAGEGRSVYLLGGNPGAAEAAGKTLTDRFPGLKIAGFDCPPFGFEKDESYMAGLRTQVVDASPDIVYVALGCPKQEHLIRDLRPLLPGAWFLGVGISFSFVSGEVTRAPKWVQRLGLEWVHRLIQEPGRLAKRYLVDDLPFAGRLFASALWRRIRPERIAVQNGGN